jgi:hypothetical protein
MLHEFFQDPRSAYEDFDATRTLPIHSPLPGRVPVGHFDLDRGDIVIDEMIARDEYLDRIQQACAEQGKNLTIRFYDHLDHVFDASLLDALDEIRSLAVEVVGGIAHPEAIGRLPRLAKLTYSPRGRTRADMLDVMRVQRLEHLTIGDTATPLLDLTPLREAGSLHTLRLLAQGAKIEAIGECAGLTELSMHPTDRVSLGFITRLQRLEVLKFSLGKTKSIADIGSLPSLRDLSFNEVHMLEELGDLQRFPRLRRLQIDDQRRLKTLKVGPRNVELEHITASGIDSIEGLSALPALKSLYLFNGGLRVDPSRLPPTLTHFAMPPKSMRAREAHFAQVRERGLISEPHPEARFFYK